MKITYDPQTDALYISLVDKPSTDAREVAPETVLDFDAEGNVVGLDIYGDARARVELSRLVTVGFEFGEVRREEGGGRSD